MNSFIKGMGTFNLLPSLPGNISLKNAWRKTIASFAKTGVNMQSAIGRMKIQDQPPKLAEQVFENTLPEVVLQMTPFIDMTASFRTGYRKYQPDTIVARQFARHTPRRIAYWMLNKGRQDDLQLEQLMSAIQYKAAQLNKHKRYNISSNQIMLLMCQEIQKQLRLKTREKHGQQKSSSRNRYRKLNNGK